MRLVTSYSIGPEVLRRWGRVLRPWPVKGAYLECARPETRETAPIPPDTQGATWTTTWTHRPRTTLRPERPTSVHRPLRPPTRPVDGSRSRTRRGRATERRRRPVCRTETTGRPGTPVVAGLPPTRPFDCITSGGDGPVTGVAVTSEATGVTTGAARVSRRVGVDLSLFFLS